MHLLINNNLFIKKYTLFYWILRVRAGPDWSAAVRRKRTRSGPRGSVRSAFEPVPNYSQRYEPSKMHFPCYFLLVGVAKRDVIRGRDADNSIPL